MNKISATPFQPATFDTLGAVHAPALDAATIDFYLRRGRAERARAFSDMIRGIFSSPASGADSRVGTRPSAEVHPLPERRRTAAAATTPARSDRAA